MQKDKYYEHMIMPDANFPIRLFRVEARQPKELFSSHWHEQIELHYFISGSAVVRCGTASATVNSGEMVLVNSNELHYGESTAQDTSYYVLIFDVSLMQSNSIDHIETKFIQPISQNLILFENRLAADSDILACVKRMIDEYEQQQTGYEIAIKSLILWLVVLLLRGHVKRVMTGAEYSARQLNAKRYKEALDYIEHNLNQEITLGKLARMISVSPSHFCRQFKALTGKTLSVYLNGRRIDRAVELLGSGDTNISEAAELCGFNDFNYFSRLFRRYKKVSPSEFRRKSIARAKVD